VAAASADKSKVVLPEEAGPQISVRQPRGSPPVSASIEAIPLETISGAGRTANREAEVTPASLASPANPPGKALCGGRPVPKSSAPVGCGQTGAPSFSSKIKGRPWAAEVETTAEDINSSGISGNTGFWKPSGVFAFYSPTRILRLRRKLVKLNRRSP
jgi:hypothetical protein